LQSNPETVVAQPRLPTLRQSIMVGVASLALGAGAAVGIYALADGDVVAGDRDVLVVGPPSAGVSAKDEAKVAAAIAPEAPAFQVLPEHVSGAR
jgi:hypothetical protein